MKLTSAELTELLIIVNRLNGILYYPDLEKDMRYLKHTEDFLDGWYDKLNTLIDAAEREENEDEAE